MCAHLVRRHSGDLVDVEAAQGLAGAVDVFLTAVQMKKGRPGTFVTVLVPEDRRAAVCDVLFAETTTIGVRFERVWRETLDRHWVEVATSGGAQLNVRRRLAAVRIRAGS